MKFKGFLTIIIFFSLSGYCIGQKRGHFKSNYKIGVKFSAERSGWRMYNPKLFPVYNGGVQVLRLFPRSQWAFETGVYLTTKIPGQTLEQVKYRNLHVPFNVRYTGASGFYFSGGLFVDYLIHITSGHSPNNQMDPNRKPGGGINGAVGYETRISDDWTVQFELRGARALVEQNYSGFMSYGLSIGLNYHL